MLRALIVVVSSLWVSAAAATTYHINVTGSASGQLGYGPAYDVSDYDNWVEISRGGALDFSERPDAIPDDWIREVLSSTTGSLRYTVGDGFSDCRGLLKLCIWDGVGWPLELNAATNTFDYVVDLYWGSFHLSPTSMYYFDDRHEILEIGSIWYFFIEPTLWGVIDTMTVTAVPIPSSVPLFLTAIAFLAALSRRKRSAYGAFH